MKDNIPNKLVFSTKSPQRRKRALTLITVLVVFQICLIWPIYPLFSSATPLIFGFPLSIVWVVGILILAATSVFIFFRKDISEED